MPRLLRGPKSKKFGGKIYHRCGMEPSTNRKQLTSWAKFQKRVNSNSVKIVKAPSQVAYEAYMRKAPK